MRGRLSAGDTIEAHCTRCRTIYNHTIVAMVEERVVRVQCNTCGGTHNFRRVEEPKRATETKPRDAARKAEPSRTAKKKADPGAPDREEWESLAPSFAREQALPYDMSGKYQVNDLVAHPTFGVGIVKGVVGPQKMEVLFQCGKKLLRCR